jgi:putative spermidine/putrescine transport system ATP-binding protein
MVYDRYTILRDAGGGGSVPRETRCGQLVVEKLTKRYPDFVAVNAIDLDVGAGEFLTLLGPSGSGKTTTLMMVAGFTTPTSGRILLDGTSIGALAPERRNIGVVFQNYALFPHMNVFENVAFPLKMRRQPRAIIKERVNSALQLVQLGGLGERVPRQLSGGQQQRVAFARSLVFGPDLLLMDEPLGALDKNLREQMQFELKRLHADLGITILYVTHDQEEALTMSDRVALMNRGAIEQLGSAEELYERPANRFVAEFIGESNVIEGQVEIDGRADGAWFVATKGARFSVSLDRCDAPAGERGLLVIRPEKLSFGSAGHTNGGIPGRVIELVYVGDFTRYRIETATGVQLTLKVQNNRNASRARQGEQVQVVIDPADARILRC